jgi:hypothetical protein
MIEEAVGPMIYKVRIKKKYPFKQMSPGETFKMNELDVAARKNSRTTTAVCVSVRFRLSSLDRMTAIIVAALLRYGRNPRPWYRGTYRSVLWFEIAMAGVKLIAKPLRPLFAMPILAADLVLDVLFDF